MRIHSRSWCRSWTYLCGIGTLVVCLSGCEPKSGTDSPKPAGGNSSAAETESAVEMSAASGDSAGGKDPFAALGAADRESAQAQRICPVSNEPLGGMGTPYKFDVDGRTVWVCCQGCEQAVRDDPATFLAKIPAPK